MEEQENQFASENKALWSTSPVTETTFTLHSSNTLEPPRINSFTEFLSLSFIITSKFLFMSIFIFLLIHFPFSSSLIVN